MKNDYYKQIEQNNQRLAIICQQVAAIQKACGEILVEVAQLHCATTLPAEQERITQIHFESGKFGN